METPPEAPAKSIWRRIAEVAVPVAVFAVGAPLLVNGIASAVNRSDPAGASAATDVAQTAASAPSTVAPTEAELIAAQIIASVDGSFDGQPTPTSVGQNGVNLAGAAPTETGATTTTVAGGHSHGGVTPEQPLTRSERAALGDELAKARTAALRYPTVADAVADGYTMVTTYLPLIGAHYIKFSLMDGTFDLDHPEMLLYDGTDPTSSIVGLSYYLFSDTVPSPFSGPNDVWHQHIGLCMRDGVVVGGENTTVAQCTARGGVKAEASNGYMVHAWVVPGWDSPQGVFSPEHIGLTAALPTS